jgi:hypothetical protein
MISGIASRYGVEIVGGYTADNNRKKIDIAQQKIPVYDSFCDLMNDPGKDRQPNKVAICLPPAAICKEIEEILKYGDTIIDTLLIIPRVLSMAQVEEINRMCRQSGLNLFFNFTPLDWEQVYGTGNLEDKGWFLEELDPDLAGSLKKNNITAGTFLDIGTGPGTQAIELAARGFSVTATDVSEAAIQKVKKLSPEVEFIVDDILHTGLNRKYDYILDRGCFHSINPGDRSLFVDRLKGLLKKEGIFFLKCFSEKEHWFSGPYRFSQESIKTIFSGDFNILEIRETEFYGLSSEPLAAFFVMMKLRL